MTAARPVHHRATPITSPFPPIGAAVWCVRWVSIDGHQCRSRMYLAEHAAFALAAALHRAGRDVAVYAAPATWSAVPLPAWANHKEGTPHVPEPAHPAR